MNEVRKGGGSNKMFTLPISIDGKCPLAAPYSKAAMKRKSTPWPHFACDWSTNSSNFCTLALGSFLPSQHNYVQVVTLPERVSEEFQILADALPIEYVATKLMWSPSKLKNSEYLAASGDGVYIWKVGDASSNSYTLTGRLVSKQTPRRASEDFNTTAAAAAAASGNGSQGTNPPAPVTSFDWNKLDPTLLVTASYDTTCTVWCLETGSIKTQLIAHDKEVFDVAFSPVSVDTFVSVGADGSLRLFDVRYSQITLFLFLLVIPLEPWIIQQSFMKAMMQDPYYE